MIARYGRIATFLLTCTATGCAISGAKYPEVMSDVEPIEADNARIVFIRPAGRYDDYSSHRAFVLANGVEAGRLGYGGFLYTDVEAGEVRLVAASASPIEHPNVDTCEVIVDAAENGTLYVDVAPRHGSVAAGIVAGLLGIAFLGLAPTVYGIDELGQALFVEPVAAGVVGAASTAAIQSAESSGKPCGGHYALEVVAPEIAQAKLPSLSWSK